MKKITGILLFTSLLLFTACSSFFKIKIIVDNPSKDVIVLSFDGVNHEIPSKSFINLEFVKGEHLVTAQINGEEMFSETISITGEGLLNPTLETYIVHKELYLLEQQKYEDYASKALNRKDHEIAGKTYQDADFLIFEKQAFIEKNWDFGVDKELPEEIKTSSSEYEVISKLYRVSGLEKTWGFFGDFDFTQSSELELQIFLDSLAQDLEKETIQ
jgi:hypothetical protein